MAQQDDWKLKIIQLECIIASKDKEISLLREQPSQDQEDVIEQLKQENEALRKQQQQQQQSSKHHASHGQQQHGSQEHSTHANGVAVSGSRGPVSKSGIVELNVGGTTMTTSMSALQQVPGSKLSTMFDPNHMHHMPQDSHARVFLPYEADAFSVLLSLLHASSVFGRASRAYTHLLRQHNVTAQPYLTDLIQHLGLQQLLEPHHSVQHYAAAGGQHTQHAGHHHTGGQHTPHAAVAGSGGGSNAAATPAATAAAAAAAAAGRAVGEWPGLKGDSKGGRGSHPGSSGSGPAAAAAADRAQGHGSGRPRRSSSPTSAAAAAAAGGGGGGSSGGGGGGGSARGEHRGRVHLHTQHGTARDKLQQQQQQEQQQADAHSEATAHAKAAAALASAAAAQSAALQALSGKGPGGGGAAHEASSSSSSTSGMPAEMVASAALKGLRQGVQPKSNRTSSSTDVLKD